MIWQIKIATDLFVRTMKMFGKTITILRRIVHLYLFICTHIIHTHHSQYIASGLVEFQTKCKLFVKRPPDRYASAHCPRTHSFIVQTLSFRRI